MEPEAFRAHNRVFAVSIFPGQDCRLKLRLGISSRNAKVSTFDGTAEPGKGFVSEGLERGGVGFGWRGEVGEVVDLEVIGDRHRDGVPLGADAFQKGPQAGILGRVSLNKGHERFTAVQGKDGAMEGRGDDEGGVEEEVVVWGEQADSSKAAAKVNTPDGVLFIIKRRSLLKDCHRDNKPAIANVKKV